MCALRGGVVEVFELHEWEFDMYHWSDVPHTMYEEVMTFVREGEKVLLYFRPDKRATKKAMRRVPVVG